MKVKDFKIYIDITKYYYLLSTLGDYNLDYIEVYIYIINKSTY